MSGFVLGSLAEVALAAPLGFMVGLVVGLLMANRYIVAPRSEFRVVPRDHSHERGHNG